MGVQACVPSIKTDESGAGAGLMAAGNYDTAMQTWIQSFPTSGPTVYYPIWQHEPDNDPITPLNYQKGFARFAKLIFKYRGTRKMVPTWCMMAATARQAGGVATWDPKAQLLANSVPTYTGTNAGTLPPLALDQVVATVDGYLRNTYSPPATVMGGLNAMRTSGYTRFGIAEVGCDQTGSFDLNGPGQGYDSTISEARQWLADLVTFCDGFDGMEFVCYFDSQHGSDNATYGWWFWDRSGAGSCLNIWAQACIAAHQVASSALLPSPGLLPSTTLFPSAG